MLHEVHEVKLKDLITGETDNHDVTANLTET